MIAEISRALKLGIVPNTIFDAGDFAAAPSCGDRNAAGDLYIGKGMFRLLQSRGNFATRVVVTHEIAHISQYEAAPMFADQVCKGKVGAVKPFELIADFIAGFATYALVRGDPSKNGVDYASVLSSLSDYDFTDVGHHGTVSERMNAFNFGQFVSHAGKPLHVAKWMENQAVLQELLPGPPIAAVRTAHDFEEWIARAIERIYE